MSRNSTATEQPVPATKREIAKQCARRGLPVFPLEPGSKLPAIDGWQRRNTCDEDQVDRWWTCPVFGTPLDRNIGICTNGLLAVDVDVKDGKGGEESLTRLELEGHEFPPTLEQHTPTGGRHLIYRTSAPVKNNTGVLGPGLDVRGWHGFIVAAGSEIDGKAYTMNETPIADAPAWLIERLGQSAANDAPAGPADPAQLAKIDPARAERRAIDYLKDAPLAVQGAGGNHTAFAVAARLKDLGASQDAALGLMLDHWNERCSPPWLPDELSVVVRNAYRYGREQIGAAAPEVEFAVADEPAPPAPPATAATDIPAARHLVTDQANANRIARRFGKRLLVAAGRWYAWDGRRWVCDADGSVLRMACRLSAIIHQEADALEAEYNAKEGRSEAQTKEDAAVVKSLRAWAQKSELRRVIDDALNLLKRMLTVPVDRLDRDPWALNCQNGTVDLQTGELRTHNPDDYITKLVPIDYDPAARAPMFEKMLADITLETDAPVQPIASFLRRWFGYSATGSTRQQCFVVHWGNGRNGKSTLIDAVAGVLADYAGTAAPGLLVSSGRDRHPTEIADLFGRRMVTAHESGEGGTLREDFVKQATGGDRMKARYMRADFFEFEATHKLQLVTNHKPIIKGADEGIWRRVLLVPYLARFGTPEEVRSGIATHPRDTQLGEKLVEERPGILAWLVAGAVEWHRDGLNPPDAVLVASADYKTESDRMAQFVRECCELGLEYEAELSGEWGGLYSAYSEWCRTEGTRPLGKVRFLRELERVVPGFAKRDDKTTGADGRRRNVVKILGLRLLNE